MNRAEHETTERINRDELHRLLDTMTPAQQQSITTRASLSDIRAALEEAQAAAAAPVAPPPTPRKAAKAAKAAKRAAKRAAAEAAATAEELQAAAQELAVLATTPPPNPTLSNGVPRLFNNVDWDELLTTAVSAMVAPLQPAPITPPSDAPRLNRKHARPFSQVAALLPAVQPPRRPRTTLAPPIPRTTSEVRSLAIPEQKAARTVAEVRARIDSGQGISAVPPLSTQVVEQLSAEEIAMLPMAIRLKLPEVPASLEAPPMSSATVAAAPIEVTMPVRAQTASRAGTILASFTVLLLLGLAAIYFLL